MSTQQQTRQRCCKKVYERFDSWDCTRTGSVERGGKWYCKQHDPIAVKAKQEARTTRYREDWEKSDRERKASQHKINCFDTLLTALEALYIEIDSTSNIGWCSSTEIAIEQAKSAIAEARKTNG